MQSSGVGKGTQRTPMIRLHLREATLLKTRFLLDGGEKRVDLGRFISTCKLGELIVRSAVGQPFASNVCLEPDANKRKGRTEKLVLREEHNGMVVFLR